jgi:8-oxo-dGTP pyrophosphatase MutT (NUDIX family)
MQGGLVLSKISQAGAIAFRTCAGSLEILLVRAKQNPNHWIFPKGHVECGESEENAALRELREEAGMVGELICHVGALDFDQSEESVHVEYYLFRYSETLGPGEGREPQWCAYDEALRLLSFQDSRDMLRIALPLIEQHLC